MDELESGLHDSAPHGIDPEIEGMIVIVEDRHPQSLFFILFFWNHDSHKMLESLATSDDLILSLFECYRLADLNVRNITIDQRWNRESR